MLTVNSTPSTGAPNAKRAAYQSGLSRSESLKVAIAVGAGFVKAWDGQQFYRLRSLVTRHIPHTGAGSAKQLRVHISNSPYSGSFAAGEDLESSTALQSLKDGLKGQWYGPLALSTLAHLAPANCQLFNVNLVASIPNPNLKQALQGLVGLHDVAVNGRRITVNITDVKPVPEGLGTAVQLASDKPVAVVDIGYQNVTVCGYDPVSKTMIGVESMAGGVGVLLDEISTLANVTGEPPTAEELRLGIEARTFELNGYSGINFKGAYEKAFEPWLKGRIHAAKTQASRIFGKCPVKVFAGGGSQLPGVGTVAGAMGVGLCSDPQCVEVRGIYQL